MKGILYKIFSNFVYEIKFVNETQFVILFLETKR